MTTFNEYRKAQEALLENNLYNDPTSKQAFLDDEKAIMSAFMYNFFGMLIGYNLVKNKKKAITYFRSDLKLQLNNITDDNNNMSLIIKILDEKGAFKSSTTANQITRFLVKLKQNSIDEVNSDILVEWMDGIKDTWWSKLGSFLRVIKEEFVTDKDQYKAFMSLRIRARIQQDVALDFFNTYKGLSVDDSKITKWTPDLLSQKSIDKRLADIDNGTTKTVAPQDVKTDKPAPAPEPAKPAKFIQKDWPGPKGVVDYFYAGGTYENFGKEYKSSSEQRKSIIDALMTHVFTEDSSTPLEKDLGEMAKFIIANTTPNQLSTYVSNRLRITYGRNGVMEHHLNRILIAQNIGIMPYIKGMVYKSDYNQIVTAIYRKLIQEIIAFGAINRLRDVKALTQKLDHPYVPEFGTYVPAQEKFVMAYLKTTNVNDFIIMHRRVTNIDGINVLQLSAEDDKFDFENDVIKKIMNEYKLEKQTNDNVITQFISTSSSSYGYGYDLNKIIKRAFGDKPFSDDAKTNIIRQFNAAIDNAPNNEQTVIISRNVIIFLKDYYPELISKELINKATEAITSRVNSVKSDIALSSFENIIPLGNDSLFEPLLIALIATILKNDEITFNTILNRIRNARTSTNGVADNFNKFVISNPVLRKLAAEKIIKQVLSTDSSTRYYYNTIHDHIYDRSETWNILTKEQQTKLLNDAVVKFAVQPQGNSYGYRHDLESLFRKLRGEKQDFMYGDMNAAAKKAYESISNLGVWTFADKEYFKIISNNDLQSTAYETVNLAISSMDEADKAEVYNRYFENEANKKRFIDGTTSSSLIQMMRINNTTQIFAGDDIDASITKIFDSIGARKAYYDVTDVLKSITEHDYSTLTESQKDAIFDRTLALIDDPKWLKKQTTAYKDTVPVIQEYFDDLTTTDRKKAEQIYERMTGNMRMRMAESYLTRSGFSSSVEGLLHNDESPITPYQKLDKKRINEILKYNNVTSAETSVPAKFIKSLDTMDAYIKDVKDDKYKVNKLEGQKVEIVNHTTEELEKISVDLHRTKRNGRHGDVTLKVLRSFKVSIPLQEEQQKAWNEAHPEQEIINPMFHGTGSIGASMILRYGFRVLKSGDSLVVGRMLGDGIYGSTVLDKAQQYVGDAGFGRQVGTKGYVFKMNAALGEQNKDYNVAGLGRDSIRSPEWCVFTPNSQFKIFHAYEVELITKNAMDELLKKHPEIVTEKSFKDYLTEQIDEQMNYTTYTFINGIIPNGPNPEDICDFAEWKSPSDNITLEPSAYGPTVVVAGTDECADFMVTSTSDFRIKYPEEYAKFLNYFKK